MRKNNTYDGFVLILAGNKCDIDPRDRRVTKEQAQEYSKLHGMEYIETSAKTG
jgi:GTPase SAR1 family protein